MELCSILQVHIGLSSILIGAQWNCVEFYRFTLEMSSILTGAQWNCVAFYRFTLEMSSILIGAQWNCVAFYRFTLICLAFSLHFTGAHGSV